MEVLTCLIDEGSARSEDPACGVRGERRETGRIPRGR
jgi:hypothetical protein